MKKFRVCIIATIITAIIICSCALALPVQAEGVRPEFYPKLTIVVANTPLEGTDFYIVDCIDKDGYKWSFFDDEGTWEPGDLANLLMWNMGAKSEEEDEIVEVYFEGTTRIWK